MCSIVPPRLRTSAVATLPGSATPSENTTMYWPGTTSGAVRCGEVSFDPLSTGRDAS